MVKKKATKEMREVSQIILGGSLVGNLTPLMQPGGMSAANLSNATTGTVNIAIMGKMTGIGFDAIDNITKAGTQKKKSKKK